MNIVSRHETYFLQAVEAHGKCSEALRQAKDRAFDAGLYLLSSKAVFDQERPGEWLTYAETFSEKLPVRTGFLYRKFAEGMLATAQEANPRLKDQTKLTIIARQTVLDSALTFMELCRELGIVRAREGGGRRSEKGLLRQEQFNFDFGILDDSLWALEKLGESALKEVPEKKLEETYTRLNTSLHMVHAELSRRPLHRLAEPARRWFWGTLREGAITCSYYLADGDKVEAARADKSIARVFPPFPARSLAEAISRLQRMLPSNVAQVSKPAVSQVSNLQATEEHASERVTKETVDTWWKAYRLPDGMSCVLPAGEEPSFDSVFRSAGVYVTGKYLAASYVEAKHRAEKIFAEPAGNTPVDISLTPSLQAGGTPKPETGI
jgi:hypothetical protein